MSDKVQGTVKWFSNKKGYGFITPGEGSPTTEDVFVHQSNIHSDGYRTLDEGWPVEFTIGHDEEGKVKAENVTAPGGGPCTGPRSSRRHRRRTSGDSPHKDGGAAERHEGDDNGEGGDDGEDGGARGKGGRRRSHGSHRQAQPVWHDVLSEEVKSNLTEKSIRTSTGTIDVSIGKSRVKLGTRGYSSMAHADGILAEGSFTCDADGNATFDWKHVISFNKDAGEWQNAGDTPLDIPATLNLSDDAVIAVGVEETAATLWGDGPTDPRLALEENGFEMRRVVLTPRNRR